MEEINGKERGSRMRRYNGSLFLLLVLFGTAGYGLSLLERSTPILSVFIILPLLLMMTFLNGRKNFLLLIAYTLGLGFFYLVLSWYTESSNETQLLYIEQHLLSSLLIFLYWLLLRHLRIIFEENHYLKERVRTLEGYSEIPQLLSYSEFLDRTDFLMAGANRCNETNYLIHLRLKPTALNKKSIMQLLTVAGLRVFRVHYDVMSQRNKFEFIVFLQNTDAAGANIACERFLSELRSQITSIQYPFTAEVLPVKQSVEATIRHHDEEAVR